jgi:hypothetical protein
VTFQPLDYPFINHFLPIRTKSHLGEKHQGRERTQVVGSLLLNESRFARGPDLARNGNRSATGVIRRVACAPAAMTPAFALLTRSPRRQVD